jgi:hypothetical protein
MVDLTGARELALRAHAGQTERSGGRLADHVARVAASVPPEAMAVAWLHEMLERTDATPESLRKAGLSGDEVAAVQLLTRDGQEPYDAHTLGLAFAAGPAGHLARIVKLADLDDHLAHVAPGVDAPPYAWARRHIAMIEDRAPRPPVAAVQA